MIHHAWTVLCDKQIIDKESNNIHLDVVEQLGVEGPGLPSGTPVAVPVALYVVSLWYRDGDEPERGRARVQMVDPSSGPLGGTEFDLHVESRRLRTISRIDALPVRDTVTYVFVVEIGSGIAGGGDWRKVASVPLEIKVSTTG